MKTLIDTAPPMKSLILASVLAFSAAFSAVLGPDPAKADYTFRPGPYGDWKFNMANDAAAVYSSRHRQTSRKLLLSP